MAKYRINGSEFAVDDSLQGEELNSTLQQIADYTASQNRQKFLGFLGASEGADYGTIVGGSKFTDYTSHPNIVGLRTKDGPSTAAGKYQITGTTYRDMAPRVGVNDFSPESQDKIALGLISMAGADDDVTSGNWNAAISKLGGRWASLPSSKYGQGKRQWEWVDAYFKQAPTPAAQQAQTDAAPEGYTPFAQVIPKADPATFSKNSDWLNASRQLYSWKERKGFQGTDEELADYGKSVMGWFNSNMPAMAWSAGQLAQHGTQSDKNAFLYMMDQYDETEFSWEGAGRAALGMASDPTNLISVGSLGTALPAKIAASAAAKAGVKKLLLTSLGRTGIQAGVMGGIQGAATDAMRQGVEVSGGRKESVGLGEVAAHAGIGAAAGLALGTAGDALLSVALPATKAAVGKVVGIVRKEKAPAAAPRVDPVMAAPEVPVATSPSPAPSSAAVEAAEAVGGHTPSPEGAFTGPMPEMHGPMPQIDPAEAAARSAPIPTVLTQDEIAAATKRGQKGRLWVDDMPLPEGPLDARAVQALVIPESAAGLRATARNMAQLTDDARKVADQFRGLDNSSLQQSLEILRTSTTLQDAPTVFRAVQVLHDEIRVEQADLLKKMNAFPDSPKGPEWRARFDELEVRKTDIALADDAMGSFGGSINRQRQEGLANLQGVTVESLMEAGKIERPAAEKLWQEMVESSQVSGKAKAIEADYEARIAAAFERGDTEEAARLAAMKRRELNGVAEEASPGGSAFMEKVHNFFGGVKELMISNLFTVKTVAINLVPAALKTFILPSVKYLATNPLEKAAVAELGAHYAAMTQTWKGALERARTAYKYEQSILTRDSGRVLEGEMMMTGRLGGALRFFPRVLNASDEFLSQLNYAGYVAGKTASKSAIEGAAQGLKGRALDDYIAAGVKIAKSTMYEGDGDALIQPIVNKGVNLGYTGEELQQYVEREAVKASDSLRHGSDKAGLDFVRDVLYKRPFSGEGEASGLAQGIETVMRKAPAFSVVVGQLFFRTPIRVFEEGIRMTPGVQILAPGFMKDLTGANGTMRQVRAQSEALASLAITGAALTLYSEGAITGSGQYKNYKAERTRKDGTNPDPYSIVFHDGSTWSFKNFDPLSTPLKIIINAFEGMDQLKIKEAQEGEVRPEEYKRLFARVVVGTMAVTQAIADANLVAGLKGTVDLLKDAADPNGPSAAASSLKKMGEMLGMLVPNTLHKIAQTNDPRSRDPATFFQVIETRLGHNQWEPDGSRTSFAYDPLGQVRSQADIGSMWNIFSLSTTEERQRGNSEEHGKVMREFDRLAQQTGAVFTAPGPKRPETGDLDLRTMMTKDGQETMFDRWQRNYRDLQPDKVLAPIAESKAPDGTFKYKGLKVELLQSEMKNLQNIAFEQLLADERIRDRLILEMKQKARAQAGMLDFGNRDK